MWRARRSETGTVRFGGGRLETQVRLCAGRLPYFVVSAPSREVIESYIIPTIKDFLGSRGLEINEVKTKAVHVTEGFNFLGFVRHEVAYTAVMTPKGGHNLVCCHQYPTQTCGWSNPAV